MFIVALFTIAKTWKQRKCPSTDEWIKKMWYIYTVEYYSAIQKNEMMLFAATWMDLEIIIVSQKEKDKYHDIAYVWNLKYDTNEITKQKQTHRHRAQTGGCRAGREGWSGSLGLADANYYIKNG